MLTQIFIKDGGCKAEYTKIAAHSFGFTGDFYRGDQPINQLFFGGDYDPVNEAEIPVWSATNYNFAENYTAGRLTFNSYEKGAGIALPINLVSGDKITLSGTAQYENTSSWIEAGFTSVNLIAGVYYFNCASGDPKLFTFIPVTTTKFDPVSGTACFATDITLGSNFDIHDTRIVIGYNTYLVGDAVSPGSPTRLTVSHTLDIERPCEVLPSQFIIKNCCDPIITELVNIPGLVVGNFHVDNEGNCWEVIEQSTDVTNFTRAFTDTYATCLECQDANDCPLNLKIGSCCVSGQEFVTGSLPGLVVGDTFVDNYGLCWTVDGETGAPISEESITVVSIIEGDCETCATENPCPTFYAVDSCCTHIGGVIALTDVLNIGDAFVDTNGMCWVVGDTVISLPTIYGIEVATVYPYPGPGSEVTACDLCITANPCPTEYFITIRSCCDNDRIEVAQVPAEFMSFNEGNIFSDYWGICWEVLSINTTGVATFEIWPWVDIIPTFSGYPECKSCTLDNGCIFVYNIKDCQTNIVYNNVLLSVLNTPSIGFYYTGSIISESFGEINSCFEVLSFGYPTYPASIIKGYLQNGYELCLDCLLLSKGVTKKLEVTPCCGGPNKILVTTIPWVNGIGSVQGVSTSTSPGGPFTVDCYTLVGLSTGTPTLYTNTNYTEHTGCVNCLSKNNIICP